MAKESIYDLRGVYEYLLQHPGARKKELIKPAGQERCNYDNMLTSMEQHGFLLSEDERGRMYAFRRVGE